LMIFTSEYKASAILALIDSSSIPVISLLRRKRQI